MEDLTDVYNDLIMEHSMNSYNKKKLKDANYCEIGHNPNCGDEITLEVKMDGDTISDMAFSGHGCAISQASTSIMIDTLKGKTVEEAKEIIKTFIFVLPYIFVEFTNTLLVIIDKSMSNSIGKTAIIVFSSFVTFDFFITIKGNISNNNPPTTANNIFILYIPSLSLNKY